MQLGSRANGRARGLPEPLERASSGRHTSMLLAIEGCLAFRGASELGLTPCAGTHGEMRELLSRKRRANDTSVTDVRDSRGRKPQPQSREPMLLARVGLLTVQAIRFTRCAAKAG